MLTNTNNSLQMSVKSKRTCNINTNNDVERVIRFPSGSHSLFLSSSHPLSPSLSLSIESVIPFPGPYDPTRPASPSQHNHADLLPAPTTIRHSHQRDQYTVQRRRGRRLNRTRRRERLPLARVLRHPVWHRGRVGGGCAMEVQERGETWGGEGYRVVQSAFTVSKVI